MRAANGGLVMSVLLLHPQLSLASRDSRDRGLPRTC